MKLRFTRRFFQLRADFVLFSRWVTSLILPLMVFALGYLNTWNILACSLFFISTLLLTVFRLHYRSHAAFYATAFFDLVITCFIIYNCGATSTDLYTLFFWTVFESSFLIHWRAGLITSLIADLCYTCIALSQDSSTSIIPLLIRLVIMLFASAPLLYISYIERIRSQQARAQRLLLREKELLVKEMELINQQMTDYTLNVQNLAVMDRLTDLFNQTYFHNRMVVEVEKARKDQYSIGLVLFDIDNFKSFNDTYGHQCGDEILRCVAKTVKDTIQESYYFAGRIGGEEFVVVMPNTSVEEAQLFADRIRAAVQNVTLSLPNSPELKITVSGGVATFPDMADDAPGLTRAADQAMYHAKRTGKNRVVLYSDLDPVFVTM